MNKIAVLIVTFNGEKWLEKCLNSIAESSILPSVYIVDNNSSDSTISIIQKSTLIISLIKSKVNLGFGKANNMALKKAVEDGNDYFLLLNQDAYLQPYTLENLFHASIENADYGIISPVHLDGDGEMLDNGFYNHLFRNEGKIIASGFFLNKATSLFDVQFVNAACWLLSRRSLEVVGGFDPLFYHYGEDDNLAQRMLKNKLKIGVLANTFVLHDRNQQKQFSIEREIEFGYTMGMVKLANVNCDWKEEWSNIKKTFILALFQNCLNLKMKLACKRIKIFLRLRSQKAAILKSRAMNAGNETFRYIK